MNTLVINNWSNIGAELKAEREKQKKTRLEIINSTDKLHRNTIELVENNKVKPTLPTLAEWVRVLGYDEVIIKFGS